MNMITNIYVSNIDFLNDPAKYAAAEAVIPVWRRKKLEQIKAKKSKLHCLGASLLLTRYFKQSGLSEIEINNIEILEGINHKPYFKNLPGYFNLSHSGNKVMLIIGDTENGCDIEEKKKYLPDIATRFYHPMENEYINSLPEASRSDAFYRIWTLKESFMKVTGLGMKLDMRSFCVDISSQKPCVIQDIINADLTIGEIQDINGYAASYIIKDNAPLPVIDQIDLSGELL